MVKVSLKNVIDMHVHSNPDIRTRAYSDFELLEAGVRVGARAIVIKSHHGTTMNRAYLSNEYNRKVHGDNSFTMFGSVTLNQVIGGLNPAAVETGFKMGAKVIWLPTVSARNHMEKNGKRADDCVEVIRDGKIVPELKTIFQLIKDYDGVLGTAHISPEESLIVVEEARKAGLKKVVVTHPEWWLVGMSLEQQVQMVKDYDIFLERCYAQPMGGGVYKSNLESNLEAIRACGYKNVMVDTDGGQIENPHWEIALEEYMQYLVDHGIPVEQVDYMTKTIPATLLGLN